ncbi:IgGFc-binding protein-like [Brienomyrus brachyistius]|uniref:IgGFc-binding protein-like n=1 Tax=Brienomyrus brachyistius TaxID=42636 RepID=UPI0020B1C880|nr:IgGFc-binding protein-like [Brienomyrus brachyistius]
MGDPHYRTFDGQYFDFMGNCTYIMAKNCHVDDDHPSFQVETKNENLAGLQVTSVGAVTIKIYDAVISIVRREFGLVRIDDEIGSLPVTVENGSSTVNMYQSGMSVILEADFGLTVQYDWEEYILITVNDSYAGKVCGLCGNFNGNLDDDLTTPSGTEAGSVVALAKSWKVPGGPGDASCSDECSAQCENCKSHGIKKLEAEVFCEVLTKIMDGPFRSCKAILEPKFYKDMCLYDFCMGKGVKKYLCNTLQVYTDACQRAGIKVFDWRGLAGCLEPKCPENSHYELCGNPCPATCGEPNLSSLCRGDCVETCACNAGYVRSGNKCVLPSECGCWYKGRYVQAGTTFWGDGSCSNQCTCNGGGKITCQETSCQNGEQCQVVNGIRDCYPISYATCMTYADPNYITFDGEQYNFQGSCVYQMASVCSKSVNLEPFEVLVQNDISGNLFGANIKLIEVKVYGQTIIISSESPGLVTNIWYESDRYCGLLKDDHGPLSSCFSKVDPTEFFQSCMNDLCLNQDKQCPANSQYSLCASGCPAICGNLSAPVGCDTSCQESCVCDKGFILSGNKCVPFDKCGCMFNGMYYHLGQTFSPNATCDVECKCTDDGRVLCSKLSCAAHEKCEIRNGVRACYPFGNGICSIYGDPHYNTFDNNTYDFQGTCTYVAATACHIEGTHLTPFTVVVENERWYPQSSQNVSVAKLVALEVYGNTLILRRNQIGSIMVNGILTNLPMKLNNGSFPVVQAYQDGIFDVIKTDFGLTIKYDLVYHVIINVPSNYEGKTCGLCGNFNYNANDDFQLPDGKTTKDLLTFGSAWKVSVSGVVCDDGCSGDICPNCDEKKKAVFQGECEILRNPNGPFANCQNFIDPNSYFSDCVFDTCMSDGDKNVLCHSIAAYVADCQNIGIEIKNWRTPTFCPLPCPANTHFEVCQGTCSSLCPGLSHMIKCVASCNVGCACNSGYFFNGTGCVTLDQCSCYADGLTYKIGESVISEDCRKICTCQATGAVVCKLAECQSDETCQIRNGKRGCYKNQCLLEAGGSFTLFNGISGDVTIKGSYNILEFCDQTVLTDWFRVVADVQMCGQAGDASVVAVHTFFEDMLITINNQRDVWVNGRRLSLPAILKNDVSVTVSDQTVIMKSRSGLIVSYSLSLDLAITVSDELSEKVCGACGKVNGTMGNSGGIQTYLDSWRAPEFPTCT